MSRHRTTAAALLVLLATWALAGTAGAGIPRLIFPVVGATTYTNDFGDPRPQGTHQGNDLVAKKGTPVVAVEPGRVVKYTRSSRAGCMLYLYGRSGTTYLYVHLNNDRTQSNDNRGGCRNGIAYAPGLRARQWVRAGQLVAYVGDSGDANGIVAHLHFEVHRKGGRAVSPYRHLRRAVKHLYARPRASTGPLTMQVYGRVTRANPLADPPRVQIRVTRVRLSNGWIARPARSVTLAVPPEAIVRRALAPGTYENIPLDDFAPDDRVRVWVNDFRDTRVSARAPAGRHTIRDILLRLPR